MLSCPDKNSARKSSDSIIRSFDHSTTRSFSQVHFPVPSSRHRPAIVQPAPRYGPGGQDNNLRPQEQGRRRPRLTTCEPFNHHTQDARRKTQDARVHRERQSPEGEAEANANIIITEYNINTSNTQPPVSHQSATSQLLVLGQAGKLTTSGECHLLAAPVHFCRQSGMFLREHKRTKYCASHIQSNLDGARRQCRHQPSLPVPSR
jgi:hypothetical protein